jgi:hypothetical protein
MACVDGDKFNLNDHGKSADAALKELLQVPAIKNGVLGDIIAAIKQEIMPIAQFNWVPNNNTNAGSAAGLFKVSKTNANGVELMRVDVTVMENKRSQVIHELVHGLDMRYYYFNISHPPSAAGLAKRVPVLYLNPAGDIWKYNVMDQPFIDSACMTLHENSLTQFKALARNNSLLKTWQRTMLMTQLDYAARADKLHVEFTSNVAQCLALIHQWGFTGDEKGGLGRPRSIALLIRAMERALRDAMQGWRDYQPPARKAGAVIQFAKDDKRKPELDGKHFEKDEWWKLVGKDKPEDVIKAN